MAYRAFVPVEKTHFADVIRWFDDAVDHDKAELSLIHQSDDPAYRVHEYHLNDGPLVQLVGTMEPYNTDMAFDYLVNYRIMGSDKEIDAFVTKYRKNRQIREVDVIHPTEIAELAVKGTLEGKIADGAVIEGEFRATILSSDSVDLMSLDAQDQAGQIGSE